MRTLFLKIFFWFWTAMALVVLATVLTNYLINLQHEEQLQEEAGGPVRVFAEMAAATYERTGTAGLNDYLALLASSARHDAYLFDAGGQSLSARPQPPEVAALLQQVLRNELPEAERSNPNRLRYAKVKAANGGELILISRWQFTRRRAPWLPAWTTLLWQSLAAFVTVGLVCYWLARYLTRPIVALRDATHRLAEGDLSARVGDSRRRDELAEMGRDFDRMAGRIESLLQAQQQLLGDISHELRSPLARLQVALAVARRKAGPEATASLDRIEREAERLNEMISQLLTLTQLETGTAETLAESIALGDLLKEIVADAEFEARGEQRHVKLNATAACRLAGNRNLLRSAIENVVRNAIRYTAPDTTVEVSLQTRNGDGPPQAVINVRDHGPGVPAEMLRDIFRPFYRVADARDRQSGGTGLGLAIAERAVRWHGGSVTAENAAEGGLAVALCLPLQQA